MSGSPKMQQFSVDDSRSSSTHDGRSNTRSSSYSSSASASTSSVWLLYCKKILSGTFHVITLPISLVFNLFASTIVVIARIVGIRPNFPSISLSFRPWSLTGRSTSRPDHDRLDPRASAEHFVLMLNEMVSSRSPGSATVTSSGAGPSTSTSTSTSSSLAGKEIPLPEFFIGSYEEALKHANNNLRLFMVILISSQHQDTQEFVRTVLANPELVYTLKKHDILVWGGDVLDSDAYHAATPLSATEYPYVGFISLSKQSTIIGAGNNGSSSSPKMTKHYQISGSPQNSTSVSNIITHIENSFVPRYKPFLDRTRKERQAVEQERMLRAQQDAEYKRAQQVDRERVMKKKQEEEERQRKERELLQAKENKQQLIKNKHQWRKWALKNLLEPSQVEQPPQNVKPGPGFTRIIVRLPHGNRIVRVFKADDDVRLLYIWVECAALDEEDQNDNEPVVNPEENGYKHNFVFDLATSFPKKSIPKEGKTLEQVEGLCPGGNLIVEGWRDGEESSDEEEDDDE